MQQKIDAAITELLGRIPVEEIPSALVLLAARLAEKGSSGQGPEHGDTSSAGAKILFTAAELAERLNLPESWLRNEERLGRIPSIRAGKYVRFNLGEVERSLADRKRSGC